MKKLSITFAISVIVVTSLITWRTLCTNNSILLGIGSFIVLSLTLIVLIWYAYDTNSIAKVTHERWLRESVLSTTYSFQLVGKKGDAGRTLVQLHNPSTLVVRAKINCNFKVYGEPVNYASPYSGEENWLLFPQQVSQGWFEIESILQKKGKTASVIISERTPANSKEQLTMNLELEFWDELGAKRALPKRPHYFDFESWIWIPQITEPK
jgi:hypothetical protein